MKFLIQLFLAMLLLGCAQVSPLTGGEKDIYAPRIITEKSFPKQGELNYTNPEVTLVFDEFIVLKNPLQNISITPQPAVPPTISSKNKKFKLTFNEPLLPNTTYSISFNGALADLNESNDSLFQYVFSTGPFIDSLQFSGSVQNAFTNKAVENVLIGLYPVSDSIQTDSLPFKIKPTYIAQTNKTGRYLINYIKTGSYQAFAYTDKDRNLLYNETTEKIAFLDSFNCCNETITDSNVFRLFEPTAIKSGLKSSTLNYPGQLVLVFHEPQPDSTSVFHGNQLESEISDRQDSLVFWLTSPYNNQIGFIINQGNIIDTIRPIMKNLPKKGAISPLTATNNFHESKILPNDTLSFTFTEPFFVLDKSMINVLDKDSNSIAFSTSISNIRTLQIIPENDSAKYIAIDSAAIKSEVTAAVNNRIKINYDRHPANYYGILLVDLKADSASNYILQLLNKKGKVIDQKTVLEQSKSVNFTNLLPGNYQLRLISDTDQNGSWTTGSLSNKKQPEKVYYYTSPIKIRSNWDLEIEWLLNNTTP